MEKILVIQESFTIALAFPTILFSFLFAEYLRHRFLYRYIPNHKPQYRYACITACFLLFMNCISVFINLIHIVDIPPVKIESGTENFVSILYTIPLWTMIYMSLKYNKIINDESN